MYIHLYRIIFLRSTTILTITITIISKLLNLWTLLSLQKPVSLLSSSILVHLWKIYPFCSSEKWLEILKYFLRLLSKFCFKMCQTLKFLYYVTHFDILVDTFLQSVVSMTRYMIMMLLTGITKLLMKKPMWNIPKLYL